MSKSYLEILNDLKVALDTDCCMPSPDKSEANKLTESLFDLLWKYSD